MWFPMPRLRYDVNVVIEKIDAGAPDIKVLERAARLVNRGEVVVCPTDTGYAFSANALDARAVAKVFHLKGRAYTNPIHLAVTSIEEAERYAHVDEVARELARRFLPGALTLVLPKKEIIPSILVAGMNTVGIRIPDDRIMLELLARAGRPLTTTSANISGQPTPYSVEEIVEKMGDNIKGIAMILDRGPISRHELSTVVDLTASPPQLIRQGLVSWLEVREIITRLREQDE
jgi:L-threonylcarbamoyladenylate synthase